MWKPDKHIEELTAKKRDELLAELRGRSPDSSNEAEPVLELFQTLGARSFMGLEAFSQEAQRREAERFAAAALELLDADALLVAADTIVEKAPDLQDEEGEALAEELIECLKVRERVELAVEGVRQVFGREPELPLELETAILSFDDLVREELWRLLPLGHRRAAGALWVEPSKRERLWWWAEGMDLSPEALNELGTAARILHLFPSAREELEKLIEAEKFLGAPGEATAAVFNLRDAVARRRSGALRQKARSALEEGDYLALAADVGEEVVLARVPEETPKVVVSSDGENLIVDIEPPEKPVEGKTPRIEVRGQEPIELCCGEEPGRFEISLEKLDVEMEQGRLVAELESGDVNVELPFGD